MIPQQMPVQERREQEQGAVAVSSGAAAQNNLRNIGLIIGRKPGQMRLDSGGQHLLE